MKSLRMTYLSIYFFLLSLLIHSFYCKKLTCTSISNEDYTLIFEVNFCLHIPRSIPVKIHSTDLIKNLSYQNFNPKNNVAVIIHGFQDAYDARWVIEMTKYLMLRDQNMSVITVDWSDAFSLSFENLNPINFRRASLATEKVAKEISSKLREIADALRVPLKFWKHLHLIGHSLGAHVAGQAARLLETDHFVVHRVTGLDPAFYCFESNVASLRLKKDDAKFVDIIHTNSEFGSNPNFGIFDPMGHIDFYPNGGNFQTDCHYSKRRKRSPLFDVVNYVTKVDAEKLFDNFWDVNENMVCDHNQAREFFIDSLKGKEFWASRTEFPVQVSRELICENQGCKKDSNCIEMGINAEKYYEKGICGIYFINTAPVEVGYCGIYDNLDAKGIVFNECPVDELHIF